MLTLEKYILSSLDEVSLYNLELRYPHLNISKEWKYRIESFDPELYIPILDFILNNKIHTINIFPLKNSFPWKIGVVYDFRYGKVKNIEIRLGNFFQRYKACGKPVIFNWLESNSHKLLLKEIASDNSKDNIFVKRLGKEKSDEIRELLFSNSTFSVNIIHMKSNYRSYSNVVSLPEGENFVCLASSISLGNKTIKFFDNNQQPSLRYDNIKVKYSTEVEKYHQAISF